VAAQSTSAPNPVLAIRRNEKPVMLGILEEEWNLQELPAAMVRIASKSSKFLRNQLESTRRKARVVPPGELP
jgi:hypothetical protein